MVASSQSRGEISSEVTGSRSQPTQPRSGLCTFTCVTDKLLFLDHAHTGYMHKLLHSGSELQCCVYVCNSGQKEEMVTGSRPKGKISPEVTGSRSQPAQPSSGLSHATSNVPIAYSSGCCMSIIGSCCMSCWLRKCILWLSCTCYIAWLIIWKMADINQVCTCISSIR